jgi:hypothetical protein
MKHNHTKLHVQTVFLKINPRGSKHKDDVKNRIKELIWKVWISLVYICVCWCLLVYVGLCWYMLLYVGVCCCMLHTRHYIMFKIIHVPCSTLVHNIYITNCKTSCNIQIIFTKLCTVCVCIHKMFISLGTFRYVFHACKCRSLTLVYTNILYKTHSLWVKSQSGTTLKESRPTRACAQ